MVNTLQMKVEDLTRQIDEKNALLEKLDAEVRRLELLVKDLRRRLYGSSSERDLGDPFHYQGLLDGLLVQVEEATRKLAEAEEDLRKEVSAQTARKTQQRKKKKRILDELVPEDLPREEVVIDVPEDEKICPETGEPLKQIGEERSAKLAYRPGHYFIKEIVRPKYAAPKNPGHGVVCAPMPDAAIPNSHFDESFAASVIVDKVAYHLPLYRQEEKLRHLGIEVSRQTLSRLYIQSSQVLQPLYRLLKEEILSRGIIFTDDTPVKLQVPGNGKTVTGRMWVYVAGGKGPPLRIFEFTRDRQKSRPKNFLGNYTGFIHADAYKGYDDLFEREGVHECACWMHIRRKFWEAEDAPTDLRRSVLAAIRLIYIYERRSKDASDEEILNIRQAKTAPIIDLLFARVTKALTEGEILPKSEFAKAAGYLINLGDATKRFLSNPQLKPDNGASERALRPLAIGRRNWMFAGSQNGGDATAVLLSLIQSCRVLDIDPLTYLTDVLRRINGHKMNRLHELLPGNWAPSTE